MPSVKISNYKSFSKLPQGFEDLRPVNVIVGKNNVGKSALLDLIVFACNQDVINLNDSGHKKRTPLVQYSSVVNAKDGEGLRASDFFNDLHGKSIYFQTGTGRATQVIGVLVGEEIVPLSDYFNKSASELNGYELNRTLVNKYSIPYRGKHIVRISADRDIKNENEEARNYLDSDGRGAANLIHRFRTIAELPTELLTKTLLDELNKIFFPEAIFDDILAQKRGNSTSYEVYLNEQNKGEIPLSRSGSGLKTVILVLLQTILMPHILSCEPSQIVFAFEELENNLHPGLQRRLYQYIDSYSEKHGATFFLTTHSSTQIDYFAGLNYAQVIHVTQSDGDSRVETAIDHQSKSHILNDLDYRASDLLQSNGVIWVEGPSDRIYLNKWIELVSEGELREGVHYQIVFYGGRLMAWLSADPSAEDLVNVLRVNRNSSLLYDSDKKKNDDKVNDTKLRLSSEVANVGGFIWETKGRTIENYLPGNILSDEIENLPNPTKYVDYNAYLEKNQPSLAKIFKRSKTAFAAKVVEGISLSDMDLLDLRQQVEGLCNTIRSWNQLS